MAIARYEVISRTLPAIETFPKTRYFKTKEAFDAAVGRDFIEAANRVSRNGRFIVGLSHGISPSGAYEYIINHYDELEHPELIRYVFLNSPLKRQRGLEHKGITDAQTFLNKLRELGHVTDENILGTTLDRKNIDRYAEQMNKKMAAYLKKYKKEGLDYVFLTTDPTGRVAAISRNSAAFGVKKICVVVEERGEKEYTFTPWFLLKSQRIAFLATKADKRRPLAWLYSRWARPDESPGFLRYLPDLKNRMTVFIDDKALTWPQVRIVRKTQYGPSVIRVDLPKPYNPDAKVKLPVIILVHGFLGLNSFDGLLVNIPSHKYIAAAMHYGSIPEKLPVDEYSKHVVRNIDAVVEWFGSRGHPVYLFDHSMGNIYFLMIDRDFNKLPGIKKYLRGRIGANPFFGEETKHAVLGFLDNVLIPSVSYLINPAEKAIFWAFRAIIPFDTRYGVRNRSINLTKRIIEDESRMTSTMWEAIKKRILYLMSRLDSIPHLNRIPIQKALDRVPPRVFVIQVHSALKESKAFDKQKGLINMEKHNIPVWIIKSERDAVAKYVPRIYLYSHAKVIDVTNYHEKDLFREHLYHMVDPIGATRIIEDFITHAEQQLLQENHQSKNITSSI